MRINFERAPNDSLKIIRGIDYSRQMHYDEHSKEMEMVLASNLIDAALKSRDTLLYAKALDNKGLLLRYHQQYDEALKLHSQAYQLIKDREVNPLHKMTFANNAGVAARYYQQMGVSIDFYMKALKLAEELNDLKNIAISGNGIGNALGSIPGREEEALKYYKLSLEAEEKRGNSLGIAMNYLSISDYYIGKHDYPKAREYLDKLLQINQERKDKFGLAITYEFYGKSYLEENKDLDKAAAYFQNSLQRFKKLNNIEKQADLWESLGKVYLLQQEIPQAREAFERSLALAQEINNHGLIMNNSYKLADIYENQDAASEALQYLKQAKRYEDSIKLIEQEIEIAAIIRQYDLEKQEDFIQLLQKDKALQEVLLKNQSEKLERRRLFLFGLIVLLLAFLVIAFLQYRIMRNKRKTQILLQKEEQEKTTALYEKNLAQAEILTTRLQINPHFIFNSLTAIKYLIQSKQNEKATKYLVIFSRYTRMVLETSKQQVITLSEELQLATYYLTLEANRFEEDFTYKINSCDAPLTDEIMVPPLLLQPFIENAIWHGLLPSKKEEKTLSIFTHSNNGDFQIVIDDNGVGRINGKTKAAQKPHSSLGMQITYDRIKLYNKSRTSKISCEVVDKKDAEGKSAGTRIILHLKKN